MAHAVTGRSVHVDSRSGNHVGDERGWTAEAMLGRVRLSSGYRRTTSTIQRLQGPSGHRRHHLLSHRSPYFPADHHTLEDA